MRKITILHRFFFSIHAVTYFSLLHIVYVGTRLINAFRSSGTVLSDSGSCSIQPHKTRASTKRDHPPVNPVPLDCQFYDAFVRKSRHGRASRAHNQHICLLDKRGVYVPDDQHIAIKFLCKIPEPARAVSR